MKLCMGCMSQIEDHLSTCPYCGFNESTLRQESYYLDPGTIIGGKYIVGRVLSYGGHTISYLGMDAEANRKVFVKEYLPSDFSTRSDGEKEVTIYSGDGQIQFERGLTNFLNEANRIQHLENPVGIARVYDCIAENDTGYVICEYVEGQTLKAILDSGRKYPPNEAKAFIKEILRGLVPLHQMDIVHCDISPETIMIANSGEIKLLDFGATRYVTTANSKSLSIILKRGYAPEEQYRSRGVRGPWTDVYALGAVMYRMITGIVPQESVERVLRDELKEPSKLGIAISENTENALMNALNVYREERIPSAEAFLKELSSSSVARIKPKKRRNKTGSFPLWGRALVASLAAAVCIGAGILAWNIKSSQITSESIDHQILMPDLSGKTRKEAVEELQALATKAKELGISLDLDIKEGDTVFSLEKDADGTIASQSVKSKTVLYDLDAQKQKKIKGLEKQDAGKEGIVKGTIVCEVFSKDKLYYRDLQGLNAYQMAKKLGIDTSDSKKFCGVEQANTSYYDLISLEAGKETISLQQLLSEENRDKIIAYQKGAMKIIYSNEPFFFWESLPDFKTSYITLANIPPQETYILEDETAPPKSSGRQKRLEEIEGMVNTEYCSIAKNSGDSSAYNSGDIIRQSQLPGSEVDLSKGRIGEPLLYVVGDELLYGGKSGNTFEEELHQWADNIEVVAGGSGVMYQPILSVTVTDASGESVEYFKKGESVTVYLNLMPTPTPKPQPPKTSSGGGYSGGYSGATSGGSSGGSGSSSNPLTKNPGR